MPPDNASYMYAAYAIAAAVYGLYSVSLWRRRRRLQERLRHLDGGNAE